MQVNSVYREKHVRYLSEGERVHNWVETDLEALLIFLQSVQNDRVG